MRAAPRAAPAWQSDRREKARRLAIRGQYRLRRAADFEAVLSEGALRRRGGVIVRTRDNGLEYARLGIIAGRKAIPRAVDRNRSKRLVREAFRLARNELPGIDIVVQFLVAKGRRTPFIWDTATEIFATLKK